MPLPTTIRRAVNVLVVDDNPAIRQWVCSALVREFAAKTTKAEDGLSALQHLETGPVDLVLLDVEMPLISGVEVLEAIRHSPQHASIMVVMMTSVADEETVSQLLKLGVSDYLLKSLSPTGLRVRLSRIFEDASRRPALV